MNLFEMRGGLARSRKFGDVALYLAAAFPLLLALVLFLTLALLSPAHAADAQKCDGSNILGSLQASDPARYEAVLDEGAGIVNGKGVFWKIEKPGLEPSWLMGTMHLTDPRVLSMPDAARRAWTASDTVIVESDEILDEKKAAAALLAKPELTMLLDGSTITKLLSPQDVERLEAGLKSRGISLTLVSRMQPWMISSFVSLPPCEITRKTQGAAFLDKKIAEDAVAEGKHLVGLETMAEQLAAMAALPMEFHLKALIDTLELGDRMNDVVETMIQLYLAGDIGLTMPMLRTLTPPGEDADQGYAAFEQRIIIDRNKVMLDRSAPYFARGKTFMAVGALHLPGEDGLVALLRKAGYTVTAED